MDRRRVVESISIARAALGAMMIARPTSVAGWAGEGVRDPGVQVLTRGFGARDLALGVGTVLAMREGRNAKRWLMLCAFADGVDLLSQLRGRKAMPRVGALIGIASAAIAAGLEAAEAADAPD